MNRREIKRAYCRICGGVLTTANALSLTRDVFTHLYREDWENSPHQPEPADRIEARGDES